MAKLLEILSAQKRLWQQSGKSSQLRRNSQTAQPRTTVCASGMRRCVTCDYRIDFKQRQDVAASREPLPDC